MNSIAAADRDTIVLRIIGLLYLYVQNGGVGGEKQYQGVILFFYDLIVYFL